MKKLFYFFGILLMTAFSLQSQAQTTVQAGNWSSPTTWGGAPPMGSGTVTINHAVTLDLDYSHTSGSITISGTGSLSSTVPMRVIALNYPAGTASLTNNGTFSIPRTALVAGTVINNGTITADSLLNSASLTNGNNGIINADQFFINTMGTLTNNGSVTSTNFLNVETVSNAGTLTTSDLANSKSFTNTGTGTITATNDFLNADTLTSPAIFTNDGQVTVYNEWHNASTVNGSGRFCIGGYSWNSGTMSGTFDFCDQTGSDVDLNTGTIAGTITYCTYSCNIGISALNIEYQFSIFPNPATDVLNLSCEKELRDAELIVLNSLGQTVLSRSNLNGQNISFSVGSLSEGLYFLRVREGNAYTAAFQFTVER